MVIVFMISTSFLWVSLFWMFGVHFCFLSVSEIPFYRVATWSTFGIPPDLESQSEFSNFQILSRWQLKAPDSEVLRILTVPSTVIEPVVAKIVTPLKQPNRTEQTQWKRKWRIKSQTFWRLTRFVQICIKRFGYIRWSLWFSVFDVEKWNSLD